MKRVKRLFDLFFSMMKIGLFTFGGGYAMISIFENEFVGKKKWIDADEFLDLVAIAESTPGPIAINCATYIGYKKERFLGSVFGTVGMCIPSFCVIFVISLLFDRFLALSWVRSAFRGIQVCVIYLILAAGCRMLKKIKKNAFNVAVMCITLTAMVLLSLLSVKFSSIFYILIFGSVGLIAFTVKYIGEKRHGEGEE